MALKLKQLEVRYAGLVVEMAARGVTDRNELYAVLRSYHQKGGADDLAAHADEWIGRLATRRADASSRAEQQLAATVDAQRKAAVRAALVEQHRSKRGWRLIGDFMEEIGTLAYTLDEINEWVAWAFFKFECRNRPNLWAAFFDGDLDSQVCAVQLDGFWNPCARRASINHTKAVADLRDYISERRARMADNN